MPEENKKQPRYDIDGFDIITDAITSLLDAYAGYHDTEIAFSALEKDGGIGWFPVTGAVITNEHNTITGRVIQSCNYPLYVVFRSNSGQATRKAFIKEFLDKLGRWLEGQKITVNGTDYKLADYPRLTDGRAITSVRRQSPAYLSETLEDGTEDWAISIALTYKNEYFKGDRIAWQN